MNSFSSTIKKLFLVACFFIIPIFQVQSQEFKGSLLGGITTSQIDGDQLSGFTKFGVFFGPSVSFPLDKKWDIGMQLLYTQKGSKADNEEQLLVTTWEKLTLNYMDVPFFLEYQVNERLNFHGGLSFGYLINASTLAQGDLTDNFEKLDFTGLLGGSYKFAENFRFLLRFNYSIFSFDELSKSNIFNRNQIDRQYGLYNSYFLVGLQYDLGK